MLLAPTKSAIIAANNIEREYYLKEIIRLANELLPDSAISRYDHTGHKIKPYYIVKQIVTSLDIFLNDTTDTDQIKNLLEKQILIKRISRENLGVLFDITKKISMPPVMVTEDETIHYVQAPVIKSTKSEMVWIRIALGTRKVARNSSINQALICWLTQNNMMEILPKIREIQIASADTVKNYSGDIPVKINIRPSQRKSFSMNAVIFEQLTSSLAANTLLPPHPALTIIACGG